MTFFIARRSRAVVAAGGALALAALLLAGCSGGSSSASPSTGGTITAADPDKEYAPGVPTLNELYASTEGEPPTSGPPLAEAKKVVFVSCGQASPGCAGPPNEMANIAEQIGWDYQIVDGALNANNGWANGIRQAIALKPDAIVSHGVDCASILQPLEEAKAAGIPVFNIQAADCDDPKNTDGPGEPLFVNLQFNEDAKTAGAFFYQWGQMQAAYVINATQGDAKIIQTKHTGLFGQYQYEGQMDMLEKCRGCEVVAVVETTGADSAAGGAFEQRFRTTLAQHPEANAAILNFDSSATQSGLSKAIVDAGRQDSMVVVAGEGYAPALQLIRENGGLTADPASSARWLAWGTVDTINRFFNGEDPVPQGIGFRMVDKDHNMMPDGEDYDPPIDFQEVYLKSWGVQ
ncbi:sugar ABC transporter substrate-binding protein [Microbacterium sp. RD1]|uniref:sugar ABC transporter substrate-binding protein n=1 Tax=Microbacterium sp. RD1 TaxID=3457313 RepID=UPI003FA5BEB0